MLLHHLCLHVHLLSVNADHRQLDIVGMWAGL